MESRRSRSVIGLTHLHAQPAEAGADVLACGFLGGPHPVGDLAVVEVEHVPMDDGLPLLGRELPDRDPQARRRGAWPHRSGARAPGPTPSSVDRGGPTGLEPDGVGRLALGDGVQPRPKVVGVAQSGVGTKGGHERLLQAVLRRIDADAADQEPMELGRVVVHQALKRRQAHTS